MADKPTGEVKAIVKELAPLLKDLRATAAALTKAASTIKEVVTQLEGIGSPPVATLGLSARTLGTFQREGINTVADLLRRSEDELLEMRNFGETALTDIHAALRRHGIQLRPSARLAYMNRPEA